ncbi:MAG: hypothetical protein LBE11_03255, partial [Prevotellaceae bacterium]|nr:hypothetical protein [Prevotellaceae bacterium]
EDRKEDDRSEEESQKETQAMTVIKREKPGVDTEARYLKKEKKTLKIAIKTRFKISPHKKIKIFSKKTELTDILQRSYCVCRSYCLQKNKSLRKVLQTINDKRENQSFPPNSIR